jgi:hypothetical protein
VAGQSPRACAQRQQDTLVAPPKSLKFGLVSPAPLDARTWCEWVVVRRGLELSSRVPAAKCLTFVENADSPWMKRGLSRSSLDAGHEPFHWGFHERDVRPWFSQVKVLPGLSASPRQSHARRFAYCQNAELPPRSALYHEPTLSHDTILPHLPFKCFAEAQDEVAGGDRDLPGLSLKHCSLRGCRT